VGKEFAKEEQFVTRWHHRRPSYWFRKDRPRPDGHRRAPEVVRLEPETGSKPSTKPPVRIFLGTEPAQARAERVFIWSVKQARDPSRTYEIHLMKDLKGFDRRGWKTGFTNYRYAIPTLAGGTGRAIYNDVDQIYLADPGELFDMDMAGAGMLGITGRETSVMLMDCARMIQHWKLEDAAGGKRHKQFRDIVHERKLWGQLPGVWNARDEEYRAGQSKCFHFTTLQTQPWQPFTDQLRYEPHPDGEVWFNLERGADAARFTPFTRSRPSADYVARADRSRAAPPTSLPSEMAAEIAALAAATQAKSILVHGSPGKGVAGMPAVSGVRIETGDLLAPQGSTKHDGVVIAGALELFPEDDIAWILDEVFASAGRFVFAHVLCYDPADHGEGSASHLSVQSPAWWRSQFELASKRNPAVRWVLGTEERSLFGRKRQIHNGQNAVVNAA
jgi:hypothetical protein